MKLLLASVLRNLCSKGINMMMKKTSKLISFITVRTFRRKCPPRHATLYCGGAHTTPLFPSITVFDVTMRDR